MDDSDGIIGAIIVITLIVVVIYVIVFLAFALAALAGGAGVLWGGGTAIVNYVKSFKENMIDSNTVKA